MDSQEVKIFLEIALSCTVSKINAILPVTQKFKMTTKNNFWTKLPDDCGYPGHKIFYLNHSHISHHFQEKMHLYIQCRNSRWSPKIAGKWFLKKNCQTTSHIPWGSCTVSKFLCFMEKLKVKMIFGKKCHTTLRILCRSKMLSKLLYLTLFLRY